jgi:hypothetical protein
MTHSDEYKPMGMSSTRNITYVNVDHAAIGRVDVKQTGSSRMFNWMGGALGVSGLQLRPWAAAGGGTAQQPVHCSKLLPAGLETSSSSLHHCPGHPLRQPAEPPVPPAAPARPPAPTLGLRLRS